MDKIELVVTHQTGVPVDRLWSAVFGMAGGTIGRAGQNKLVLPDADAAVARVHAMVRLDSDRAYIANLCERRSVLVSGLEVLSGQEVPLLPGAEIGIGPYQLIARLPGEARRETPSKNAAPASTAAASVPSQPMQPTLDATLQTSTTALNLASLPNPWADIPSIVGGESYLPELADLRPQDQHGGYERPPSDNPFEILGRIETPTQPPSAARQTTTDNATPNERFGPGATTEPTGPQGVTDNPFERSVPVARSLPLQPSEHRAMVIPDDFDPFAADPKEMSASRDTWSGDLAAKSLAEIAQLKHDELLLSLPKTSQFAGEMDNAAHTGLPKQLDPSVELNPLKLFREPGEAIYAETADHGMSRGSDLTQVFSMPREIRSGLHTEPARMQRSPVPQESKVDEPVFAAGLPPTQGLDLGLFGGATTSPTPNISILDTYADEASGHEALPLQTTIARSEIRGDDTSQQVGCLTQTAQPSERVQGSSFGTIERPAVATDCHAPVSSTIAAESLSDRNDARQLSQALANAFLDGAGIAQDKVSLSITPEFMRTFGEAIRIAVQGSIDLLSARSEIKREFRADVTIIASGANNPLKFLPTAEGVMLQLTGQTFPGFMKPVPAMQEAYNDLAVHQIALMAGIRAAYAEATARLSPAELEKSASKSAGLLTKVSALHRKAALWDDYQQRYESIRRHAEDDLMAFSGKTFVEAYETAAQAAEENL